MKSNIVWITRTAAFTALVVVTQFATAALGNTLVTGTLTNMILIVSTVLCGLRTGLTVAALSPVLAKLIGIGPFWTFIPFIALGNAALTAVWSYAKKNRVKNTLLKNVITVAVAAVIKFLIVFTGVVKIAVPFLLELPAPAAAAVSSAFSVSQLFTASAGGALALLLLPILKIAIKEE